MEFHTDGTANFLICDIRFHSYVSLFANVFVAVEKWNKSWTMSSVAVLTPESFAEHRSGLKDQENTGKILLSSICIYLPMLMLLYA